MSARVLENSVSSVSVCSQTLSVGIGENNRDRSSVLLSHPFLF